ncbi:succinoglycan biosynthesis protein ExoM [Andreprevotia lacus DSM 23236]|jgi:glycosyltransferase involved in cell wall biosynthesis|uniref:Succinoglycan biosynthesis protein ExoM n=1 Tax=Andreprevotia lacus DSM 23236 TaxID=1121001 RepID=A0A1W1XHQ8_9NEIS|nr:glycosyltransferase family A protein [Andreprevotia lacus]SMC23041.1 succinoglycan biosynthesis protein ExoM [Andreprevotia lacus DSM 23236]
MSDHLPIQHTVAILVCTYRRPAMLAALLDSLAEQQCPGIAASVYVIDNDGQQSAAEIVVSRQRNNYPLQLTYLHEPQQNISLARNRGLDHAQADYIAFIDDDEVAVPGWLQSLVETAQSGNADLVFGPVIPVYPANMPHWLISGGFYERPRHDSGTTMPLLEARTGNVLIASRVLGTPPLRFDPALGLSGGEDYVFFRELFARGCKAVWADEAEVREEVPQARADAGWLVKRSFRIGSVEASLSQRDGLRASARIVAKIAWVLGRSVPAMLLNPFRSRAERLSVRRRTAIGLGLLYGLLRGPYREYK